MQYKKVKIDELLNDNVMLFSQYIIKNRALPDLYSGMKPIHSKILWSMYENKTFEYVKSATVSGRVFQYSPHGDCYDTIVNMVQKDRHLHPLIDGDGSWGKFCSTEMVASASRYTECKLSNLAIDCLEGVKDNMVEMIPNYDNSCVMPKYTPTKFPLILCMASNGMAVGMANNSPSFNLIDVCDNTIKYLKGDNMDNIIPDFACGGKVIYNKDEIKKINNEGIGKVVLRAKYHFEDNSIIITEIPYGNKIYVETIVDKIIELCKKSKIKEITDVLDQSGKDGLSIEISCKKNTDKEKLMQKLYTLTPLQSNFVVNMNVLVEASPMVLGVKDTIIKWSNFRQQCMINKIKNDIDIKSKKLHKSLGLKSVLLDIDKAIEIIKKSETDKLIISNLMTTFNIDEIQANYISDIKLRNINHNYILKQIQDIDNLQSEVEYLKSIVDNIDEINKLIISELEEVKKKYGKPRQTEIIYEDTLQEISSDELIEDYNCRLLLTSQGYIKKHLKQSDNHKIKDDDFITQDEISTNKSDVLLFSNRGNRYKIPCYELGTYTPSQYGDYIPNLIKLDNGEEILSMASIDKQVGYMLCVYQNGKISKIDINSYLSNNKKLTNCYSDKSKLMAIKYIKDDVNILLVSSEGKALIVNTDRINPKSSRNSQGNVGMKLDNHIIVGCIIDVNEDINFELETEKGKSKEFMLNDIAPTGKNNEERTVFNYILGRCGNGGSFLINCRTNNDKVIKFKQL